MAEIPEPQTIGELLALIAHDLRNPLSALHSNLGFLKSLSHEGDADAEEAIEDGLVSCDGLSHIIDNIDLFGQALRRVESAGGASSDLVQVVREVVRRSEKAAGSHGLRVVMLEPEVDTIPVGGSYELLERAVANLVRNSIQHAPAGSVVQVQCFRRDGEGAVRVEDAGVGLAQTAPHSVFSASGQVASKAAVNGRYSRGMGLYCAGIASVACGGRLRCLSRDDGSGNVFELSLPMAR